MTQPTSPPPIPLVDLHWQYAQVAEAVAARWQRILSTCDFILGQEVAQFEEAFSAFTGVPHCVAVANGTDALELLLRAHQVGTSDEVIVPANSFIATALAVERTGATLRLVDCTADQLIDPAAVRAAIGPRTVAIIPVHLYGQHADMAALRALADPAGLLLIEDAAQAQGARQAGRHAGADGGGAATSFYPGKNLGALGDAGAVLTADAEVAERIRGLRNYGSVEKYVHRSRGFNSRLDTIQAAVLLAKLERLTAWNSRRHALAHRYQAALADTPGLTLPRTLPGNDHVWHLYVVHVEQRDRVLDRLRAAGVGAGIHYPIPIHRQGAFDHLGLPDGSFPNAEWSAQRCLSLPLYPGMTEEQQDQVVAALVAALVT